MLNWVVVSCAQRPRLAAVLGFYFRLLKQKPVNDFMLKLIINAQ